MNVLTDNNIKCTIALAGLQQVVDPEIGLNVVDMGLIYRLNFDEEKKQINCLMTLSTQFCPMGESIVEGVINNLRNNFSGYEVCAELTFTPPWNFHMISEEGRQFLTR